MSSTLFSNIRIFFALFCILFGLDKFVSFLPTCSLTEFISPIGMFVTGILELIFGSLLLFKQKELLALRILTAITIGGLMLHLIKGRYDISGGIIGSIIGLYLIFAYKKLNNKVTT